MKINFDEIFKPNQHETSRYLGKGSQVSTTLGYDSLFSSTAKKLERTPIKINKEVDTLHTQMMVNAIKTTKQQENIKYKYFKPSKCDDLLNFNVKKKTQSKSKKRVNNQTLNIMTQRLHQPIQCSKKNCKNNEIQSYYKKLKKNHLYNQHHQIHHQRSLTETCEILKQPSELHERLYWEHKEREFRNIQLENQYNEKQKTKPQLPQPNKQYLKNYTKFFDRLQHQVSRRMKKQHYYTQNPNLNTMDGKIKSAFQPNIAASMRSLNMTGGNPKIIPKGQKHAIKGQGQMNKKYFQELNMSIESLNRSQQIVKRKQDKIKQKFCRIFENQGLFQATPEAIEQLNQDEFQILFPLLQQIEEEKQKILIEDFEKIFEQYYQELSVTEKQVIRAKPETERQKFRIPEPQMKNNFRKQSVLNTKPKGDYLKKIQNFV